MTANLAPSEPTHAAPPRPAFGNPPWLRVLRPRQWVKNLFILAPLLFSGRIFDSHSFASAVGAFVVFCALASGVYLLNDVIDRASDRIHPIKQFRPIASGQISATGAVIASLSLLTAGLAAALLVEPRVAALCALYVLLNVVYSTVFKRIVILDVFTIASFFVIRLLVGAWAVRVAPSIWLLLCGGLLALYLAFAKRRHELELLQETSAEHRVVLSEYSTGFLDQLSVVLLAITVVAYIMYTLESQTARDVGSDALAYSTVFVLYGVIRYLFLVHRRDGGDPAESLLTDRALLVSVVFWVAYCAIVIYRPF